MKKFALTLALAGFMGAGVAAPAYACEGGKCKMEQTTKDAKAKKGKKAAAKAESCHMSASSAESTKSCCMKKDTVKAEASKEKKAQ